MDNSFFLATSKLFTHYAQKLLDPLCLATRQLLY